MKTATELPFPKNEIYDLRSCPGEYILPRLKAFKEYHRFYPMNLNPEVWNKHLDTMIYAFENCDKFEDVCWPKVNAGFRLFGEYFQDLWS